MLRSLFRIIPGGVPGAGRSTTPSARNTTPRPRYTTPQRRNTTPQRRNTPTRRRNTAPRRRNTSIMPRRRGFLSEFDTKCGPAVQLRGSLVDRCPRIRWNHRPAWSVASGRGGPTRPAVTTSDKEHSDAGNVVPSNNGCRPAQLVAEFFGPHQRRPDALRPDDRTGGRRNRRLRMLPPLLVNHGMGRGFPARNKEGTHR